MQPRSPFDKLKQELPTSSCDLDDLALVEAVSLECGHLDSKKDADARAAKANGRITCHLCRTPCDPAKNRRIYLDDYANVPKLVTRLESESKDKEELQRRLQAAEEEVQRLRALVLAHTAKENKYEQTYQINPQTTLCAMQNKQVATTLAQQVRALKVVLHARQLASKKIAQRFSELANYLKVRQKLENEYKKQKSVYESSLRDQTIRLISATTGDVEKDAKQVSEISQTISELSGSFNKQTQKFQEAFQKFKSHPQMAKTFQRLIRMVSAHRKLRKIILELTAGIKQVAADEKKAQEATLDHVNKQTTTQILPMLTRIEQDLERKKHVPVPTVSEKLERKVVNADEKVISNASQKKPLSAEEQIKLKEEIFSIYTKSDVTQSDVQRAKDLLDIAVSEKMTIDQDDYISMVLDNILSNYKKRKHYPVLAKLLIERANASLLNIGDANNDTALHWAAYVNDLDLVLLIISKNVDPTLKNNKGKTPRGEMRTKNELMENALIQAENAWANQPSISSRRN